jgi:hypothetical protein
MDSDDMISADDVSPGEQASIDQNVAGANNRIDYLLEQLAAHLEMHPQCPGPWCVSEPFAEGVVTMDQPQMGIVITIMARRLVELA